MSKRDRPIQDPFDQNDRPEPLEQPTTDLHYDEIKVTLQDGDRAMTERPAERFEEIKVTLQDGDRAITERPAERFEEIKVTLQDDASDAVVTEPEADIADPPTGAGFEILSFENVQDDPVGAASTEDDLTAQPEGDSATYYPYELTNLQDDVIDG